MTATANPIATNHGMHRVSAFTGDPAGFSGRKPVSLDSCSQ
jgi:hypothetical protein